MRRMRYTELTTEESRNIFHQTQLCIVSCNYLKMCEYTSYVRQSRSKEIERGKATVYSRKKRSGSIRAEMEEEEKLNKEVQSIGQRTEMKERVDNKINTLLHC